MRNGQKDLENEYYYSHFTTKKTSLQLSAKNPKKNPKNQSIPPDPQTFSSSLWAFSILLPTVLFYRAIFTQPATRCLSFRIGPAVVHLSSEGCMYLSRVTLKADFGSSVDPV